MVAELRSGSGMGTLQSERVLRLSFTALLLQVSLAPPQTFMDVSVVHLHPRS